MLQAIGSNAMWNDNCATTVISTKHIERKDSSSEKVEEVRRKNQIFKKC